MRNQEYDSDPLPGYVADEFGQYASPGQIMQKFQNEPWRVVWYTNRFNEQRRHQQLQRARMEIAVNQKLAGVEDGIIDTEAFWKRASPKQCPDGKQHEWDSYKGYVFCKNCGHRPTNCPPDTDPNDPGAPQT